MRPASGDLRQLQRALTRYRLPAFKTRFPQSQVDAQINRLTLLIGVFGGPYLPDPRLRSLAHRLRAALKRVRGQQ